MIMRTCVTSLKVALAAKIQVNAAQFWLASPFLTEVACWAFLRGVPLTNAFLVSMCGVPRGKRKKKK